MVPANKPWPMTFSRPELPVTRFPLVFHFRRGVIHPPRTQAEFASRSVSSLSWSTRTPSTKTSAEKCNPSVDPSNKVSEPRTKLEQGGGEDFDVSFEDDNVDKDDKEMDFFPMTDKAMDAVIQGKGSWETDGIQKGIKMCHCQAFMEKTFPA